VLFLRRPEVHGLIYLCPSYVMNGKSAKEVFGRTLNVTNNFLSK
jgi:hypothetical protein